MVLLSFRLWLDTTRKGRNKEVKRLRTVGEWRMKEEEKQTDIYLMYDRT